MKRASSQANRLIAGQVFWLGLISAVHLAGGVVGILLASRILGPAGYGALAIIMATAAFVHGIIAIPGSDTITTYVARCAAEGRPRDAGAVVRFVALVSLGLALVAYLLIGVVVLTAAEVILVSPDHTTAMLAYALVGVVLANNSAALAILRIANRLRTCLAVACAETLVRIAALTATWSLDGGLLAVVSASLLSAVVGGAGLLVAAALAMPRVGIEGALESGSVRVPRDVFRFHLATFGRAATGAIGQNADTILLAQFIGAADVGLYRAARHITDMARQPFGLVRIAVQPVISRLWYGGDGRVLRETIQRFTSLSALVALFGFTVLALFAEPIAIAVLGHTFVGVHLLILVLIPGAFVASLDVLTALPPAVGRPMPSLVAMVSGLVASIIAIFWLVPMEGVLGGAWARTVLSLVTFLVVLPFVISIIHRSRAL